MALTLDWEKGQNSKWDRLLSSNFDQPAGADNEGVFIVWHGGASPEIELGAYVRKAVSWLEGRYLTLRPGFADPGTGYAYLTTSAWDDATGRLKVEESGVQDGQCGQQGYVLIPDV